MVNNSGELVVLKDEKRAREGEQRLRREQEREYDAAVKADMERQHQREQVARVEKEKKEAKEKKLNDIDEAKARAVELLDRLGEVGDGQQGSGCKVVVQMPSGKRIERVFNQENQIKHVRAMILIQDETTALDFKMVSRFPKKVFSNSEEVLSAAFNNAKSQLLFLESTRDESIEDSSSDETSSDDE